jgi:hypothetical protein
MDNAENWSVERLKAELAFDGRKLIRPIANPTDQPVCCCENGGRPFQLNGEMVTCWNVGCKVHKPLIPLYDPVDFAEPINRYVRRETLIRDLRR